MTTEPHQNSKTRAILILLLCSIFILVCVVQTAKAENILVYGDSLSAGYGIDLNQGWVALLQERYANQHTISNASISGETTAGGLARLPLTLQELKPDVLFLELGANDGLQGLPLDKTRQNLSRMIDLAQENQIKVVLTGITVPESYGPRYVDLFRALFVDLAKEKNIAYLDLVIPDFASKPGYIQEDGLHPSAKAQPEIRDYVANFIAENNILTN